MSAPVNHWPLIDRVREAGYDWLTLEEKRRLHNLEVRFKAMRTISPDDLHWLEEADANLRGVASLSATFSERRRKGGER
jgi:hypothetical protein